MYVHVHLFVQLAVLISSRASKYWPPCIFEARASFCIRWGGTLFVVGTMEAIGEPERRTSAVLAPTDNHQIAMKEAGWAAALPVLRRQRWSQ